MNDGETNACYAYAVYGPATSLVGAHSIESISKNRRTAWDCCSNAHE